MTDYKKYINALRKCAKEHEGERISTGQIIVSNLCEATAELLEKLDTAELLEKLEQEPCEDAISRADAVKVASGYCHPQNIAKEIAKLPPATPKAKTGHWINKSLPSGCGIRYVASVCTCCGKITFFDCDQLVYNYCPNCGAKMIKQQESEDK